MRRTLSSPAEMNLSTTSLGHAHRTPLATFKYAVLCLCLVLCACDTPLYTALTEQEANEVVALLRQENIKVDKIKEGDTGWSVKVSQDDFAMSMEILSSYGVPARAVDGLGKVFKKESLVSTPTEERARLTYAMAQELQRSIAQIDGVIVARVHPVLPQKDALSGSKLKASASVLIKHRPDIDMTALIPRIRSLVANGIDDLEYENVTVLPVVAVPRNKHSTVSVLESPPSWQLTAALGAVAGALLAVVVMLLTGRMGQSLWRKAPEPEAELY